MSKDKVSYSRCKKSTFLSKQQANKLVPGRLYFIKDMNQILRANTTNTYDIYGGSVGSDEITVEGDVVTLEMQDNKVYSFTNNNIASISLTIGTEFSYCTVCFTAGTATTWTVPNNSRCIGYDCSGGIFTPVAGNEYQIAVDKLNNLLTFYVLNTSLEASSSEGDS